MGATKLVIMVLLISALFWSCSSKLSEDDYYNKAREAYGKEKYEEALQNFKLLVENYPQGKKAAEASFMLGFINANDLKNYDEAKKYYTEFIN
ncbi:MAG TPA: tetratricopeptide repeat protein, partial [Calditrichaeota bacterium]|nr:tetratricopeptide repeat protein [Calditrichota bacterium]